jgi:hypothetical protein
VYVVQTSAGAVGKGDFDYFAEGGAAAGAVDCIDGVDKDVVVVAGLDLDGPAEAVEGKAAPLYGRHGGGARGAAGGGRTGGRGSERGGLRIGRVRIVEMGAAAIGGGEARRAAVGVVSLARCGAVRSGDLSERERGRVSEAGGQIGVGVGGEQRDVF